MLINDSVKTVLKVAILKSIKEIGIENFKKTSFFGSSQSNSEYGFNELKKAA